MASYVKRGGKWRVQVRRKGVSKSGTFYTKAEAREWAIQVEREIDTGTLAKRSTATISDAFARYSREVSPRKKGRRWEQIRLKKLEGYPLADIRFKDLQPEHIAQWRDQRLTEVSPSSVAREMALISGVLTVARKEWKWIDINPIADVSKPRKPPHRDRRISADEIRRVCLALGYDGTVHNYSTQVAVAFLLALETGMRLGELCAIKRRDINLARRYVRLQDSKNDDRRDVPLSSEAVRLIESVPERGKKLFQVSASVASTLFRRARDNAEIPDLTFHDSRHEACTRLARKLNVLELAKMIGHRDPRSLLVYFNPTPHEIAARLDADGDTTSAPRQETSADASQSERVPENPACK